MEKATRKTHATRFPCIPRAPQVKLAQDIINRNQKGMTIHRVPMVPVAGNLFSEEAAAEEMAEWQAARRQGGEGSDAEGEEGDE